MAVAIYTVVYMFHLRLLMFMVGLYVFTALPGGESSGDARQPCLNRLAGYKVQLGAGGCASPMRIAMFLYSDILHLWLCRKCG